MNIKKAYTTLWAVIASLALFATLTLVAYVEQSVINEEKAKQEAPQRLNATNFQDWKRNEHK